MRRGTTRRRNPTGVRAPLLALAALLLVLPLAPAAAIPAPAPLLDEREFNGPFWFVYRFSVEQPKTKIAFEVSAEQESGTPSGLGLWTMRVGQERPHFYAVGAGGMQGTEARLRWQEPVPANASADDRAVFGKGYTGGGTAIYHDDLKPGDYWFVAVNTGPWQKRATVRAYGSAGVQILATAQGREGGQFRETDFATDRPYTHVRTGVDMVSVQTHELRDARIDHAVNRRLFGVFTQDGGNPARLRIVGPDGSERPAGVLSGACPGTYSFKVDEWVVPPSIDVGVAPFVALLFADVELPERPGTLPSRQRTKYYLHAGTTPANQADRIAGSGATFATTEPAGRTAAAAADSAAAETTAQDARATTWSGRIGHAFNRLTVSFWQAAPLGHAAAESVAYDVTLTVGGTDYRLPSVSAPASGSSPTRVLHEFDTMLDASGRAVPLAIDPAGKDVTLSINGRSLDGEVASALLYGSAEYPSGFSVEQSATGSGAGTSSGSAPQPVGGPDDLTCLGAPA